MPSSLEDYQVIGPIGSGSYGSCWKIRRIRDNKLLVWKVLDYLAMSDFEKQTLVVEVNLLRELRHEHIVRYYDRIVDRHSSRLYIVMELCPGGDLAKLISQTKRDGSHIEEDFVWQVCWQITSALNECHGRREKGHHSSVMHRDLKPANVFLDARRNVKLGDFGVARVLQHDTSFAQTFVGTPNYMSPELMNGHPYNEKSDVWSLGCLFYELCALVPPFTGSNHAELCRSICLGCYKPLPTLYSTDMKDLIGLLLQVESSKRPSIKSLLENSMLQRHFTAVCITCGRESAAISDSSSDAAKNSLKRLAAELQERSNNLLRREIVLAKKEKVVAQKERKADERMAMTKKIMLMAVSELQPVSPKDDILTSSDAFWAGLASTSSCSPLHTNISSAASPNRLHRVPLSVISNTPPTAGAQRHYPALVKEDSKNCLDSGSLSPKEGPALMVFPRQAENERARQMPERDNSCQRRLAHGRHEYRAAADEYRAAVSKLLIASPLCRVETPPHPI